MIDLENTMAIPELLDFMLDDMGFDNLEVRTAAKKWSAEILNAFDDEVPFSDIQVEASAFVDGYEACLKNHGL